VNCPSEADNEYEHGRRHRFIHSDGVDEYCDIHGNEQLGKCESAHMRLSEGR
jgi:hypothetical protein